MHSSITSGARGRISKIMVVVLARKLLVALWRYVECGEQRRLDAVPSSSTRKAEDSSLGASSIITTRFC